jgi:hypothetical protein
MLGKRLVVLAGLIALAGCANHTDGINTGTVSLRGPSTGTFLHFTYPGDDVNSGSLNYRELDQNALVIVGAGTGSGNRAVRVYDNFIVTGKMYVSGTLATITAGKGPPTSDEANGAMYLRTDGTPGKHLYISSGKKVWRAVPGV